MFDALKKRRLSKDIDSGAGNTAPTVRPETEPEPAKEEEYQIPCLHAREYKKNSAVVKATLHNQEVIATMQDNLKRYDESPDPPEETQPKSFHPSYANIFFTDEKTLLNSFTGRDLKSSLSKDRLLKRMKFAMLASANDDDEENEDEKNDTLSRLYAKLERMSDDEFNDLINYIPFRI